MTSGTLITVAPTGPEPVTLDELVTTARECESVGAAVIHVHVNDADSVKATVQALRAETDLVIQLSSDEVTVLDAEPDMVSLGADRWDLHKRMQDRGIVPAYEIVDLDQLAALRRLLDEYGQPAGGHVHVDFVLNSPGGLPGTTEALVACKDALRDLPEGTTYTATGIGSSTIDVMMASLSAGGHLRVGTEDTVDYREGEPVESNMQLVARAVAFARLAERPPLSTDAARAMLGVAAS
ncbi:MAG TPA: 3-keto-5-aminohexanoate cleavage protein [Micromonosporaceae bacterium]|jgi:uncharacterized protein (DUF849 family)